MSRSDTPGCYRGMLRVLLGAVLLPLLVLGCLEVQSLKLETNFHAAEAAFRQEIETERLIGAERPRVLAFLKRKGVAKTIHMIYHSILEVHELGIEGKPLEEQPVFRIDTPGVSSAPAWFGLWTSEVEFRFDRKDRLASYRFTRDGRLP